MKLIRYPCLSSPIDALFDLENDPAETNDVASERPEDVQALASSLARWTSRIELGTAGGTTRRSLSKTEQDALRSLGYLE